MSTSFFFNYKLSLWCKKSFLLQCSQLHVNILVDAVAYGGAYFGQGATLFIHIDKLRCSGLEPRLIDCPHDNHTLHCTHANDASVVCQQRKY